MSPGLGSIILVVVLIVLLFGRGKISALMGDLAKGITSFKKGLKEDSGDDDRTEHLKGRPANSTRDRNQAPPQCLQLWAELLQCRAKVLRSQQPGRMKFFAHQRPSLNLLGR